MWYTSPDLIILYLFEKLGTEIYSLINMMIMILYHNTINNVLRLDRFRSNPTKVLHKIKLIRKHIGSVIYSKQQL